MTFYIYFKSMKLSLTNFFTHPQLSGLQQHGLSQQRVDLRFSHDPSLKGTVMF